MKPAPERPPRRTPELRLLQDLPKDRPRRLDDKRPVFPIPFPGKPRSA